MREELTLMIRDLSIIRPDGPDVMVAPITHRTFLLYV